MKTIGKLVMETLDYSERGLFESAFVPACDALRQTAENLYNDEDSVEPKFQRFIRENWQFISFMGLAKSDAIPNNLPFGIRRAIPTFMIPNVAEEIFIFAVRQTLSIRRMPLELGFSKFTRLSIENEKLLFPKTLLFALIGIVVFNPVNKNESIPDDYWLNIWDFKMFVSELWGRDDILKRIMKLYTSKS